MQNGIGHRALLQRFIDDIYETYKISIGVLDLQTLVFLAFKTVHNELILDEKQLLNLRGFYHV